MFLTLELFPGNSVLCGQVKEVVEKARLASTGSRITRGPCGFVTSALWIEEGEGRAQGRKISAQAKNHGIHSFTHSSAAK